MKPRCLFVFSLSYKTGDFSSIDENANRKKDQSKNIPISCLEENVKKREE